MAWFFKNARAVVPAEEIETISKRKAKLARQAARHATKQSDIARRSVENGRDKILKAKQFASEGFNTLSGNQFSEAHSISNSAVEKSDKLKLDEQHPADFYEIQQMHYPMKLIPSSVFKCFGEVPRSNHLIESTSLEDIQNFREQCFIVFISHRWWSHNHPDRQGVKYSLLVEALVKMEKLLGPTFQIMVWMDFYGIDQDDNALKTKGILSLPAYIYNSDCLLTPLTCKFDQKNKHTSLKKKLVPLCSIWDVPCALFAPLSNSQAEYFGRAWCRLEFYLGTNAPLCTKAFQYFKKLCSEREGRPHFLFYPEFADYLLVLPALNKAWMEQLSPLDGQTTCNEDMICIKEIMAGVPVQNKRFHAMKSGRVMEGVISVFKTMTRTICREKALSGFGACPTNGGGMLAGQFRFGGIVFSGVLKRADGFEVHMSSTILGLTNAHFEQCEQHGKQVHLIKGKVRLALLPYRMYYNHLKYVCVDRLTGDRYEGTVRDLPQGRGVRWSGSGVWISGDLKERYEGQFSEKPSAKDAFRSDGGCRHGYGILYLRDGSRYEGEFKYGKQDGFGVLFNVDGSQYHGEFQDGKKHGQGILLSAQKQEIFKGQFKNGSLVSHSS